jgi:hypothetical protein
LPMGARSSPSQMTFKPKLPPPDPSGHHQKSAIARSPPPFPHTRVASGRSARLKRSSDVTLLAPTRIAKCRRI